MNTSHSLKPFCRKCQCLLDVQQFPRAREFTKLFEEQEEETEEQEQEATQKTVREDPDTR